MDLPGSDGDGDSFWDTIGTLAHQKAAELVKSGRDPTIQEKSNLTARVFGQR